MNQTNEGRPSHDNRNQLILTVILLLVVSFLVFKPGLTGGFLLDDQSVLQKLALIEGSPSLDNVIEYIKASNTGPLKRPISVLSFLIDGQNWPTSAYPFKLTNLLIHVVNGLLLFLLIYRIFGLNAKFDSSRLFLAFFATSLWLFNPFLISTTFYVVQRMTMLPVLFSLIGLNLYLTIRLRQQVSNSSQSNYSLLFVIYSITLLAIFSKENGVLFLLYVGLFEWLICLLYARMKPLTLVWQWWLFRIPLLGLILMIVIQIPGFINNYDFREFSLSERLLSQPRAVGHYLLHLFTPEYFTEGVFTDGFVKSESLFKPIDTVIWLLTVIVLMIVPWFIRHKWPLVAFSIWMFFASQILESTIVPLELYFEHRAYAASLFLFIPLAIACHFIIKWFKPMPLIQLIVVGIFALMSYQKSNIWGNQILLHQLSIEEYPESVRAPTLLAIQFQQMGHPKKALAVIEAASQRLNHIELKVNLMLQSCYLNEATYQDFDSIVNALNDVVFTKHDIIPYETLYQMLLNDRCHLKINDQDMLSLLSAFEHNAVQAKKYANGILHSQQGQFQLIRAKDATKALQSFKLSFEKSNDVVTGISHIYALEDNQAVQEAIELTRYIQKEIQESASIKLLSFENKLKHIIERLVE